MLVNAIAPQTVIAHALNKHAVAHEGVKGYVKRTNTLVDAINQLDGHSLPMQKLLAGRVGDRGTVGTH